MSYLKFDDVKHLKDKDFAEAEEISTRICDQEKNNSAENKKLKNPSSSSSDMVVVDSVHDDFLKQPITEKESPSLSPDSVLSSRYEVLRREKLFKKPMEEEDPSSCDLKRSFEFTGSFFIDQDMPTTSSGSNSLKIQELPRSFDGSKIFKMVNQIVHKLGGAREVSEPVLIVQKELVHSDVNRFVIPRRQMDSFLNAEDEIASLRKQEVTIIEPNLNVGTVTLANFQMMTSDALVLSGNWSSIVMRNGLALGMVIQLWAVRLNHELVFVLTRPPGACKKVQKED